MKTFKTHAVLSAYTGILLGNFGEMHEYIEHVMGRGVQTMEMASEGLMEELKQRIKDRGDLEAAMASISRLRVQTGDPGEVSASRLGEVIEKIGSDKVIAVVAGDSNDTD